MTTDVPTMTTTMKIAIICLGLITSVLLICLQPHVNPDVIESQKHIRGETSHEFRILWENVCFPIAKQDLCILVVDILLLVIIWSVIFRFCRSPEIVATCFGLSFVLIHLAWYVIYKDGFIMMNSLVSAAIFVLVIYHSHPVHFEHSSVSEAFRSVVIQEKANNIRHLIGLMYVIAVTIGASALATSFTYMEKMFGPAERALFLAQRSVVTILFWNLLLFAFFLLPTMYGKINRVINLLQD